jgi:hypothetical protein
MRLVVGTPQEALPPSVEDYLDVPSPAEALVMEVPGEVPVQPRLAKSIDDAIWNVISDEIVE